MTVTIDHLLTREATLLVRQPATEDALGDWTYDEVASGVLVELQPVTSSEEGEGAILNGRWRVFLTPSAPVTGWDALVIDGDTYETEGDPAEFWLPLSRSLHHLEVDVVRSR